MRELNVAYDRLGGLANHDADSELAREYFTKAFEIRKKILDDNPGDLEALRDLCVSYDNFGTLAWWESDYKASSDFSQAQEYFIKAFEIRQKIIDDNPDDFDALRGICVSYDNLAWASGAQRAYKQERDYYKKAFETLKRFSSKTRTIFKGSTTCIPSTKAQRSPGRRRRFAANDRMQKKLAETLEKAVAEAPNYLKLLRDLSRYYDELGAFMKSEKSSTKRENTSPKRWKHGKRSSLKRQKTSKSWTSWAILAKA